MGQLCDIVSHLVLILRSNMREQNLFSYSFEIQINFIIFISYLINKRRYEWKHIGFKSSAGEQKTSFQCLENTSWNYIFPYILIIPIA